MHSHRPLAICRSWIAYLEIVEDWAVWSVVTVAGCGETLQCPPHRLKRLGLAMKFGSPRQSQRLDVATRSAAIIPQSKQLPNFLDSEAKVAGATDEAQRMNVPLVIIAIARRTAWRRRDQPDLFIMSDHSLAHGRGRRGFPNLHNLTARRRRELAITSTELNDMAALAIIGLRTMPNVG